MKKLTKVLLMLAVSVTVIFAASSVAMAADSQHVTMNTSTSPTELSFTVDLTNFTPTYFTADDYNTSVTGWTITDVSSGETIATGSGTYEEESGTCPTGYAGRAKLTINFSYTSIKSGYSGSSEQTEYFYLNAKPAAISKSSIGCNVYSSLKKAYFTCAKDNYATGVQFKMYNMKTGKCVKTISCKYSSTDSFGIASNVAYKYRARQYYTNETTGKTYYGAWSSYRYFINPYAKATKNYSTGKVTVKVKGISKVAKYEIRVSNSNDGKGGTLVKTLKPSTGKYKSYTFKTSKSYIKVVPVMSGNNKSDTYVYFYN